MGVGLGRSFLRHIQRCKVILHVLNGESKDPVKDFKTINRELVLFDSELANKPQVRKTHHKYNLKEIIAGEST